MQIRPAALQCDCGSAVIVIDDRGHFTCPNPKCENFEKVFRPVEMKAVRVQKTYREMVTQ
jgi:hypothetical protein